MGTSPSRHVSSRAHDPSKVVTPTGVMIGLRERIIYLIMYYGVVVLPNNLDVTLVLTGSPCSPPMACIGLRSVLHEVDLG